MVGLLLVEPDLAQGDGVVEEFEILLVRFCGFALQFVEHFPARGSVVVEAAERLVTDVRVVGVAEAVHHGVQAASGSETGGLSLHFLFNTSPER